MPGPRRQRIAGATLVALAILPFLPALAARYAGDDFLLLRTIGRVGGPLWPFTHNDLGEASGSGHFYRPLWVAWNWLLADVLGGGAALLHAGNLVLYALVCLEVWALARLLLPAGAAWITAAAFALFPRHGESVAWISGNTDLTAVALLLAAVLLGTRTPRPIVRRAAFAAVLGALALLCKEAAIVAPVLAALVLVGRRRSGEEVERRWWAVPVAMLGAQLVVFVARAFVVGGLGGYTGDPFTPKRAAGSLATDAVGALAPAPQLTVLINPLLGIVPLVLLALVALRVRALARAHERATLEAVALGIAWALVALVPVLNLPLDLNTGNGDRLLLLPSVGLALAAGALLGGLALRGQGMRVALAAAGALLAASSVLHAYDWVDAGRLADRVTLQAAVLAPRDGELVVLALPESLRQAYVFPDSFDVAVARAGRPDALITWCVPVLLDRVRAPGSVQVPVHLRGAGRRRFVLAASDGTAFDVPVLGDPADQSAGCSYRRSRAASRRGVGAVRAVVASPRPSRRPLRFATWDGVRIVPLASP